MYWPWAFNMLLLHHRTARNLNRGADHSHHSTFGESLNSLQHWRCYCQATLKTYLSALIRLSYKGKWICSWKTKIHYKHNTQAYYCKWRTKHLHQYSWQKVQWRLKLLLCWCWNDINLFTVDFNVKNNVTSSGKILSPPTDITYSGKSGFTLTWTEKQTKIQAASSVDKTSRHNLLDDTSPNSSQP